MGKDIQSKEERFEKVKNSGRGCCMTTLDCTIVPVGVRNIPEIFVRIPSLHHQLYKWVTFFELCNSLGNKI